MIRKYIKLAYLALAVAAIGASTEDTSAARPDVVDEFDVARGGDLIILPVTVLGKEYRFILDTGCGCCCFDTHHRGLLGSATGTFNARAPGGSPTIECFLAPSMRLGNTTLQIVGIRSGTLRLSNAPVAACIDLGQVSRRAGTTVDGILGMDALRHLVVNINFDAGKIRIMSTSDGAPGKPVPIIWHRQQGPFIAAKIDGRFPCEFLLDTGAIRHNIGSLDLPLFDRLQSTGRLTPLRRSYSWFSAGKKVDTRLGQVESIAFGEFQHAGAIIERLPFWSSVGIGFLTHYNATLDFPNNVLFLEPGQTYGVRDSIDGSGLNLKRTADDVVVERVIKGDAGEASGVHAGDVLVSVDGELVSGWSVFRIQRRFCGAGEHGLVVRRNGTERSIRLSIPAGPEHPCPSG